MLLALGATMAGACDRASSTDASVVRFDAATGERDWDHAIQAPQFGDALVAFGQLEVPGYAACSGDDLGLFAFDLASGESHDARGYAVVDVSGADALVVDADANELRLVDSASDDVRWRSEFPCAVQVEGGTCTLDTIDAGLAGDLALVSHDPETTRTILDALRRDDGSAVWSTSFDGARTASAVRNQAGATGPALVYLNGNGGPDRIVGVDRATGDALWTVELESDLGAGLLYTQFAPTRSGEVVVFPGCDATSESGCGLVAVDRATGDTRWRFDTDLADRSAVDDTGAYTLSGRDLVALESGTGEVRWRVPLDAPAPTFHLAVDGERVYAALADGTVVAFDVGTGAESWRSALPGAISADFLIQMVASHGGLFVVGHADIRDLISACSN